MEQTDLGPFADCHEKFALAWKYANEADKTRSKSRRQEFYHHFVMAFLYTLYAGDFDRSVVEAEAAIEMAPNEAGTRAVLASCLSDAGRHEQAIEWASMALRLEHNAAMRCISIRMLPGPFTMPAGMTKRLRRLRAAKGSRPDYAAVMYLRVGRVDEARAIIADWVKKGASRSPPNLLGDEGADEERLAGRPAQGGAAGEVEPMPEEPQALHADEGRLAARMVAVGTSAIRRSATFDRSRRMSAARTCIARPITQPRPLFALRHPNLTVCIRPLSDLVLRALGGPLRIESSHCQPPRVRPLFAQSSRLQSAFIVFGDRSP